MALTALASSTDSVPTAIFPLTTVFTPAPTCFSLTSSFTDSVLRQGIDLGCFPVNWRMADGYSPGVCPQGYGTSATLQNHDLSYGILNLTLSAGESAFACCPNGYQTLNDISENAGTVRTCYSVLNSTTSVWGIDVGTGFGTFLTTPGSSSMTVLAWGIDIFYQSSDLSVLPALTTKTSTSSSQTSSSTTSSTSHATTSPTSSSSHGLSTGAKAGLGIGIPIFCVLAALAIFFLFRRHGMKKRTTEAAPMLGPTSPHTTTSPHMSTLHNSAYGPPQDQTSPYLAGPYSPQGQAAPYIPSPQFAQGSPYASGGYWDPQHQHPQQQQQHRQQPQQPYPPSQAFTNNDTPNPNMTFPPHSAGLDSHHHADATLDPTGLPDPAASPPPVLDQGTARAYQVFARGRAELSQVPATPHPLG
ncbi:MAG: hypothetical protein M1824_003378 [Vezdaea acicularis]|nr:MAG: hypothetical protein M1824_003378 [Vezdaea acicularis]